MDARSLCNQTPARRQGHWPIGLARISVTLAGFVCLPELVTGPFWPVTGQFSGQSPGKAKETNRCNCDIFLLRQGHKVNFVQVNIPWPKRPEAFWRPLRLVIHGFNVLSK